MARRPVPWFFAPPDGPPPWPGLVVVHENLGMTRQILYTCERLAGEGYATLAPDLYGRFWGEGGLNLESPYERAGVPGMLDDLADSVARLRGLGASRVGMVGFCMGGTMTYATAVGERGAELSAAVVFYAATVAQNLGTPRCPLLGFFAGRDEFIPRADVDAIADHHPGRIVVYPEAGHAFMRDGSRSHEPEAAADAWARMLAFLDEHVRAATAA